MKKIIILLFAFILLVTNVNKVSADGFYWPIENYNVSSTMYYRVVKKVNSVGYHTGWDMTAPNNKYVYATADGVVTSVGTDASKDEGINIVIEHTLSGKFELKNVQYFQRDSSVSEGTLYTDNANAKEKLKETQASVTFDNIIYSKYCHLKENSVLVKVGDKVKGGAPIGIIGNTGKSTAEHLHFAINTFDGKVSKKQADTRIFTADGIDPHFGNDPGSGNLKNSYNCLSKIGDNKTAAISPNIIFEVCDVVPISESDSKYVDTNAFATAKKIDMASGNENVLNGEVLAGGTLVSTASVSESPITDNIIDLSTGQEITKYGEFSEIETALASIQTNVIEIVDVVSLLILFLSVMLIGIAIILKRNNPKERVNAIMGLFSLGTGLLLIKLALDIVSILANNMEV